MRKLLFLFTLFMTLQIEATPDIDFFTCLAKLLRQDTRHNPPQEEERIQLLIHKIMSQVPDYGETTKFESLITAFVSHALQISFSEDQIYDSKKTPFFGRSTAKVFFIKGRNGSLKYVVKAFPNPESPSSKFLAELSGLALLQDSQLPHVSTVLPLALAKCRCHKHTFGLLLLTAAPGKRADSYLSALATPDNRQEKMQAALKMMRTLGLGLAELHQKPSPLGYQHGDSHLKNIFYDAAHEKIVLIDVSGLHQSLDIDEKPLSDGSYDLQRVRQSLATLAHHNNLTSEETAQLHHAFLESYRSKK